jgi:hypothetical protein
MKHMCAHKVVVFREQSLHFTTYNSYRSTIVMRDDGRRVATNHHKIVKLNQDVIDTSGTISIAYDTRL